MKAIKLEAMLLRWSETSNGGATIVLQLADVDDLKPFKRMTLKKGSTAGQRLALAIVEIGDDEQPVQDEPKTLKGGELSQLAGRWCNDLSFQQWMSMTHPDLWPDGVPWPDQAQPEGAEAAAQCVRKICGVTSRAMIDHDPNAGRSFHKLIREPYYHHLEGLGLVHR